MKQIYWMAAILAALYGWHKIDKHSAVRKAVTGYVADQEIATLTAERDEALRQARVSSEVAQQHQERRQVAEGQIKALANDIEEYINETDSDCVVPDALFDRLRS